MTPWLDRSRRAMHAMSKLATLDEHYIAAATVRASA